MENKIPSTTPAPQANPSGRKLINAEQKRVLGRGDLMGIAVGQIIGAGIMTMIITALGMTGRSISLAFFIAAMFTIIAALPAIFFTSVIRIKGGIYSQAAIFIGKFYSGFYIFIYILQSLSLALFALSMTSYAAWIFPAVKQNEMIFNVIFITAFFVLNYFGTEWMSKAQSFMFYLLIVALVLFVVFGLPKSTLNGYFTNLWNRPYIEHGFTPLMQAGAYLTFATGGATVILSFSGESKNPTKDAPFVIIVSTVCVAILYATMAVVVGSVMPPEEIIKAGNLAPVASKIMPAPAFWFFIIAGAGFALGTTLNSSIASRFRPFMQAIDDGWLPEGLGKTNKHGAPIYILLILYVVSMAAILFGLGIKQLGSASNLVGNINSCILPLGIMRLPKLFPENWKKSPYHVPDMVLNALMVFASLVAAYQLYLNARTAGTTLFTIAAGAVVFALTMATVMNKSGKVNMNVSYELE